jgi:hypothetical protein
LECRPLGRAWMLVSATGDVMDIWGMGRTWGPFKNPVYIYIYTYIYIMIYLYIYIHSCIALCMEEIWHQLVDDWSH